MRTTVSAPGPVLLVLVLHQSLVCFLSAISRPNCELLIILLNDIMKSYYDTYMYDTCFSFVCLQRSFL